MKYKKKIMCVRLEDLDLQSGEIARSIEQNIVDSIYPYYIITNYGRIYNVYTKRYMKPAVNNSGYLFVYLATGKGMKYMQIHRLVMLVFNPIQNPEQFQVNHDDGNKFNNHITNLYWCTPKENIDHAYRTGLMQVGENHSTAKITDEQAKQICDLLVLNKYTNLEIANITNSTESIVSGIKQKNCWRHISEGYTFYQRPGRLFSDEELCKFCEYFENNKMPDNMSRNEFCRKTLIECGYEPLDRYVEILRKLYTHKQYKNISQNYNF